MGGRHFQCENCSATALCYMVLTHITDALPGAIFYDLRHARGFWMDFEGKDYCGTCSGVAFPQLLDENIKYTSTGATCY